VDLLDGIAVIDNSAELLRGMREDDDSDAFENMWKNSDIDEDLLALDSASAAALPQLLPVRNVSTRKIHDTTTLLSWSPSVKISSIARLQNIRRSRSELLKSEMKRIFCSIIDIALMEIGSRFGERSKTYVRA
jgi:hypothetical protein